MGPGPGQGRRAPPFLSGGCSRCLQLLHAALGLVQRRLPPADPAAAAHRYSIPCGCLLLEASARERCLPPPPPCPVTVSHRPACHTLSFPGDLGARYLVFFSIPSSSIHLMASAFTLTASVCSLTSSPPVTTHLLPPWTHHRHGYSQWVKPPSRTTTTSEALWSLPLHSLCPEAWCFGS